MEQLVNKYAQKLITAGLAEKEGIFQPLVGGLDDTLVWNRTAHEADILKDVFKGLNINSLVFLKPKEPYAPLLAFLAQKAMEQNHCIEPKDCETRTFLHDLPIIKKFNADLIIQVLKKRKSVIIASPQKKDMPIIIAHGTVSPEQGFVTVSSVCFACFIKFFTDYLEQLRLNICSPQVHAVFDRALSFLKPAKKKLPNFSCPPFKNEKDVYSAIIKAGKQTVAYDLVDSYFGNISYLWNNTLYISQTGSSLDQLQGCIDPVPMDGSSSAGLTASSELSAHMKTLVRTNCRAILHGHPKFSVIMSMDCDPDEKAVCNFSGLCHIKCPKKRFIASTPIVPGEVGTGPTGLCNTLPPALEASSSAIVYGHGLFTTGKQNFSQAFASLLTIETHCREIYFQTIEKLRHQ
ncbi:MAG: class II aldolase/adducin family protein [Desulfobacula sp.]|nr:class II aldolase/adducin family protein [Desulfobacula sp.]